MADTVFTSCVGIEVERYACRRTVGGMNGDHDNFKEITYEKSLFDTGSCLVMCSSAVGGRQHQASGCRHSNRTKHDHWRYANSVILATRRKMHRRYTSIDQSRIHRRG